MVLISKQKKQTLCRHKVIPKEILSRFIFDKKHIRKDGSINAQGFKPSSEQLFSVFRTSKLSLEEIKDIYERFVKSSRPSSIGYFNLFASDYSFLGLNFDPDGKPYLRHVNVIDWPEDNLDIRQELSKITEDRAKESRVYFVF